MIKPRMIPGDLDEVDAGGVSDLGVYDIFGRELLKLSYEDLNHYLISDATYGDDPERACRFKQALEGLSAEAREVVDTALNAPDELVRFVMGKGGDCRMTASDLRSWFRWKGWTWDMIRAAFGEVKKILNVM